MDLNLIVETPLVLAKSAPFLSDLLLNALRLEQEDSVDLLVDHLGGPAMHRRHLPSERVLAMIRSLVQYRRLRSLLNRFKLGQVPRRQILLRRIYLALVGQENSATVSQRLQLRLLHF